MSLRCSTRLCGSFILNQRLVVDWHHPFFRADIHSAAQSRLQALQRSSWYRTWSEGGDSSHQLPDRENGGAEVGESSEEVGSGTQHSTASASSSPPPPMHLLEANALTTTFTNQRNIEDLTTILRYTRDGLHQPLTSFHYHALLRLFAYQQDKAAAVQLLEVMEEEAAGGDGDEEAEPALTGEEAVTLETYARVMDMLHTLSPSDVLDRLLTVIELAQDRFLASSPPTRGEEDGGDGNEEHHDLANRLQRGGLGGGLCDKARQGSEAATVQGMSADMAAGQLAMLEPDRMPDVEEGEWPLQSGASSPPLSASSITSAPLSSLLHHLAHRPTATSALPALVAVLWMRSLGAVLCDWDYFHTFSAVLIHRSTFPFVQWCVGVVSDSATTAESSEDRQPQPPWQKGWVRPSDVLTQLQRRYQEVLSSNSSSSGPSPASTSSSSPPLPEGSASSRHAKRQNHGATPPPPPPPRRPLPSVVQQEIDELQVAIQLAEAMMRSLRRAGISPSTLVYTGACLNSGYTDAEGFLLSILEETDESGVGPQQLPNSMLYHGLGVLWSAVGDNSASMEVLRRAAEKEEMEHGATLEDANGTSSLEQQERDRKTMRMRLRNAEATRRGGGEAGGVGKSLPVWRVSVPHLLDAGALVDHVSAHTIQSVRDAFTEMVQRRTAEASVARHELELQRLGDPSNASRRANTAGGTSSVSYEDAAAVSPSPPALCAALSLAVPPAIPTPEDLATCENCVLPMLSTSAEAMAALQHAIAATSPHITHQQPRHVRHRYRQLLLYCALHPFRRNPKFSKAGLQERRKWNRYLTARDTALTLFGSTQQGRDAMKDLFYNEAGDDGDSGGGAAQHQQQQQQQVRQDQQRLAPMRSQETIRQDREDICQVLSRCGGADGLLHPPPPSSSPPARLSLPHLHCSPDAVPTYLYDPNVFNPYPHCHLRLPFKSVVASEGVNGASPAEEEEDVFLGVWNTLMNPHIVGQDRWFLKNTDIYLLLMRCLLQRLDWEAAVELTHRMLEETSYTYKMDSELTRIFREVGDPSGCLAFKAATNLFDGRIIRDGQVKRKQFHAAQERQRRISEEGGAGGGEGMAIPEGGSAGDEWHSR